MVSAFCTPSHHGSITKRHLLSATPVHAGPKIQALDDAAARPPSLRAGHVLRPGAMDMPPPHLEPRHGYAFTRTRFKDGLCEADAIGASVGRNIGIGALYASWMLRFLGDLAPVACDFQKAHMCTPPPPGPELQQNITPETAPSKVRRCSSSSRTA